ncbi:MAG: major facilitator superfamily 1 [Bacteroidetes bacterium]|nr:major facilitator superfamily 1 [Bacteroidota bacterium]
MRLRKPRKQGDMVERLADFLALRKNTAALLLMVILVGMGERIAERYLPLYLLALGGGIASVGLFSGANNLVNALYSFFGGYISDRIGHKRALLLFSAMTIVGYTVVIVFPYWQAVIVGSFFFLSWSAISMPATLDLVAQSVPMNKRAMGVSMNSLIRRVPMILGPLLGGILIERFGEMEGIRYSFLIALLLAGVSLVVQQILIGPTGKLAERAEANPFALWKEMSGTLKNLLVSDILVRFCEQIPYAFVVVWCVKTIGISPLEFGVLTTVEMLTALLIYIPVAHFADKTTKKPFIVATFGFFAVFPLILLFSRSFVALVLAFVVRGLKEFGEPTRKSLILDLSPEEKRAGMFGFYYLLRDSIVSVAAFAGAWLWDISPTVNLLVAFGFGVIGTIWFQMIGED